MMQFRTFTWPNNPSMLRISASRNQKLFVLPFDGETVQDLGRAGREITGEGVFYGENAKGNCLALESLLHTNPSGMLTLPQGTAFQAYFYSFTYLQDTFPHYFSYTFAFREVI